MAQRKHRNTITDGVAARWIADAIRGKEMETEGVALQKGAKAKLQDRYGAGNFSSSAGDWDTNEGETKPRINEKALAEAEPELYARLIAEYGTATTSFTRTTVRAPKGARS